MTTIGIDAGYSSVKITVADLDGNLLHSGYRLHHGNVIGTARTMIEEALTALGPQGVDFLGITGSAWPAKDWNALPAPEGEMEATLEGCRVLHPKAASIISIGGQNARYITGLTPGGGGLRFASNGECASGTGSFFEDQAERIGFSISDYSDLTENARNIPSIAGRCSVFAKTDIIHRQQEGVPAEDILLGLSYAMVRSFKNGILKNETPALPVLLCGGIAKNRSVVRAFLDICGMEQDDLIVTEKAPFVQALGAALLGAGKTQRFDRQGLFSALEALQNLSRDSMPRLERLPPPENLRPMEHPRATFKTGEGYSLGIDIGSTSTNLVLLSAAGEVLDYQYLRTSGNPKRAVLEGLASIKARLPGIRIDSAGTTGSGRVMIGMFVGADTVTDEITAQARGALEMDGEIDTIFEIGGQDSKYIRCGGGIVSDFQMNRICAAGTGSFLEEQALKFGLDISEMGPLALKSTAPADLGERCTVFIESNVGACIARGVPTEDIAAGLCRAIVRNYLDKVVGTRTVGAKISLQGGIARNPGIVAAFEAAFPGKIRVVPYYDVTGALGAAFIAREGAGSTPTRFKGLDIALEESALPSRDDLPSIQKADPETLRLFTRSRELFLSGYTGKTKPGKKTVGIPRVLVIHKLFPMVHTFFSTLGYNVILSDETSEATITASRDYAVEETCYPVKLILGHAAELIDRGIDYLFLPALHTMRHPGSNLEHNYGCVYMQAAPALIARMMKLDERGITLLSPVLELEMGKQYMAKTMVELAVSLGFPKPRALFSMMRGGIRLNRASQLMEREGKKLVSSLREGEPCFVIVTRTYGIADPVLNMGIPEELMRRGHRVIELSHLPAHGIDISDRYPNMYWPFGQHIIAGLRLIRNHPNLYAVYLTNHGCGPDTILAHFARNEMGNKPYLAVEVDEHYSRVGVITRIEAFINSVDGYRKKGKAGDLFDKGTEKRKAVIVSKAAALPRGKTLYIPRLGPYSTLIAGALNCRGIKAEEMVDRGDKGIERGQRLSISKEYLSVTALVGDCLLEAENDPADKAFLSFTCEGSEAEGQAPRLLRLYLDENGARESDIVAPFLERVGTGPGIHALTRKEIFALLHTGDLIMALSPEKRKPILDTALSMIREGNPLERVMHEIEKITRIDERTEAVMLLAVGDPQILFNSPSNRKTESLLGEKGVGIAWAPFSEYLLFLWNDSPGVTEEDRAALAEMEQWLERAASAGNPWRRYSLPIERLTSKADSSMPVYTGANGRYRLAKAGMAQNGTSAQDPAGVLAMASMYENTSTIISILAPKGSVPTLELRFDGARTSVDTEIIDAFLFGLREKEGKAEARETCAAEIAHSTRRLDTGV